MHVFVYIGCITSVAVVPYSGFYCCSASSAADGVWLASDTLTFQTLDKLKGVYRYTL